MDEKVCLPDYPKTTVSLATLQNLEKHGETTFKPEELMKQGIFKKYNVQELLGTVVIPKKNREVELSDEIRQTGTKLSDKIEELKEEVNKPNWNVSLFGTVGINNLNSKKFDRLWKSLSQPISFPKFSSLKKLLLSKIKQ
ncbi:hypothetical protein BGP_1282 [Beggiatoa sp. PS]|nr:hypothetical protein BGP_1282 [Beggiatoa sp. PS]